MSPTEEDNPAEQQISEKQHKPHVESRDGQDVSDAGDGIFLSQVGVDASTFTGHESGEQIAIGFIQVEVHEPGDGVVLNFCSPNRG